MPQFLFIAEIPPADAMSSAPTYSVSWQRFAQAATRSTGTSQCATRLHEGAWLLEASGAMQVLTALANAAEAEKIPYSVLLLGGEVTRL